MKSGQQLVSQVCTAKVIVVRAPSEEVELSCGGVIMVETGATAGTLDVERDPELFQGTSMGKRYVDSTSGLQVLCVTAGEGTLASNGVALVLEGAKPLPSSD
jgi:hypothetical protein